MTSFKCSPAACIPLHLHTESVIEVGACLDLSSLLENMCTSLNLSPFLGSFLLGCHILLGDLKRAPNLENYPELEFDFACLFCGGRSGGALQLPRE